MAPRMATFSCDPSRITMSHWPTHYVATKTTGRAPAAAVIVNVRVSLAVHVANPEKVSASVHVELSSDHCKAPAWGASSEKVSFRARHVNSTISLLLPEPKSYPHHCGKPDAECHIVVESRSSAKAGRKPPEKLLDDIAVPPVQTFAPPLVVRIEISAAFVSDRPAAVTLMRQ